MNWRWTSRLQSSRGLEALPPLLLGESRDRGRTEDTAKLKGPFFCDKGLLQLRRRRQPSSENCFFFSSRMLASNDLVSYKSGQDGFQFVGTVVDLNTLESMPKMVMLVGEVD